MSQHAATPDFGMSESEFPNLRASMRKVADYWWVFLLGGIAWIIAAVVILQFNHASITAVGIIIGALFCVAGIENIALATVDGMPARWVWAIFGGLFLVAGIICFANPADTFAGTADIIGFLFLMVGIWWMVRAFLERPLNPTWWLGLISGVLMTCLAFWTSGQFFIHKAYILLVFAGIWALMHGITDVVRAFEIRKVRDELT